MRFLAALLVMVVAATAARAEDRDAVEARKHYTDGSRAFALGDFQHAIEEYKAGYKIRANPEFLFNIAQAYRLAGDPAQAIFFYKSYLSNAPNADNRDEVEMRIHACEAQLQQRKAQPPAQQQQQQQQPATSPAAPPPTVAPAAPAASAVELQPPPHEAPRRSHKTAVALAIVGGVVVVGGAVALGLALGLPRSLHTTLPTIGPNASRLSLAVSY